MFGLVKFGEDKFIIIVNDAYAKGYKVTMKLDNEATIRGCGAGAKVTLK